MRSAGSSGGGKQMRLVQFRGPIRPEWYEALGDTGVRIVTYIPNNAYLVYGDASALLSVRAFASRSIVQWDAPYLSQHRLSRVLRPGDETKVSANSGKDKDASLQKSQPAPTSNGNQLFAIQLVADDKENAATIALIDSLKLAPILRQSRVMDYVNNVVGLPESDVISQIAERGDVVSISRWSMPHRMDERQDMIMAGNLAGGSTPTPGDYRVYLAEDGFATTTTSLGVNITDSGVDNGTRKSLPLRARQPDRTGHSRMVYTHCSTPNAGSTPQGCDGQRNLNTYQLCRANRHHRESIFWVAQHADASGFLPLRYAVHKGWFLGNLRPGYFYQSRLHNA